MRNYPSFPSFQGDTATLWTLKHVLEPHTPASSSKLSQDADDSVDTPFPVPDESQMKSTFVASSSLWPIDPESKDFSSYSNASELCGPKIPELSWPSDDSSQYSDDVMRDTTTSSSHETAGRNPIEGRSLVKRQDITSLQSAKLEDTIICATDDPARDRKYRMARCHNQVEKNYRNRLNKDFQLLLNALAECACMDENDLVSTGITEGTAGIRSKGSILRLARRRLLALRTDNGLMASELKTMRHNWMESQMGYVFNPKSENAM
jgi:hypothetical protein